MANNSFSDKPLFTLKQLIGAISIAIVIGGGITRFEYKTSSIDEKLETLLSKVDSNRSNSIRKFTLIENKLLAYETQLHAVTTSLTAIKPDEITIRRRRR